jgi:hypothetical protein
MYANKESRRHARLDSEKLAGAEGAVSEDLLH